jgi:hypothetical protein
MHWPFNASDAGGPIIQGPPVGRGLCARRPWAYGDSKSFLHFWLKTIKKQSNSDSRFKLGDQKNNKTIFIRPAAKT